MTLTTTLCPTANFKLEVEHVGLTMRVTPWGTINEDVDFGELLVFIDESFDVIETISFDMSKLDQINSCGVRECLLLMERLTSKRKLEFACIDETWIDQSNIIPSLLGPKGTAITNIIAPYFCSSCDRPVGIKLKTSDLPDPPQAPEKKCPQCSKILEFDALEDEFFSFIQHTRT